MLLSVSLLSVMLITWLAVTALLIVLAIVRAVISLREEDQLYIDPGEERLLAEQREIVARLERLRPYLIGTVVASVVLGLATFGLWVYRQLQ
ncbi:MAG: hypothetical protein HY656_06015 [Acidobacteria bacterium]|nr:hypothetical protein [Acidobacteriota bacterium]